MKSWADFRSTMLRVACFTLLSSPWAVSSVQAQTSDLGDRFEKLWSTTNDKWVSYGQGDTLAGNLSVNSGGQLMKPVWQNENSLLFGDFRGRTNDHGGIEGNIGLGFRQLTSSGWILGGYGFYDIRRSNFGNTFQQATLGIEAMSLYWDARFNGYIPDGRSYTMASGVGVGPATPVLIGNQMALSYSGALIERSYYGFDGEVGYLLASSSTGNAELRGFVGAYDFATTDSRFPQIIGPRARLEGRLYDLAWLFGNGSRLVAGFEYQYDQVRDSQYIGMVQVRIPLGRSNRVLTRLERRMLDTVVRDVDVVSQSDLVQTNQVTKEAAQIQSPIDGRWESVGNIAQANSSSNLSNIVNSLGSSSTVFVDGTGGPLTVNSPIVMQDTQRIFGGGEVIELRGATSHDMVSYVVPGAQPTLIAANPSTNVFVVGNNDRIGGFNILGGDSAISASPAATPTGYAVVDRLVIQDTTISGASSGVNFGDLTNSLIQNVNSSGNASFGFDFNNLTNTVLEHNVANNNGGDGFLINGVTQGSSFNGNSARGNSYNGFQFDGVFNGQFVNNSAYANSNAGMAWVSALTGTVTNNNSSANGSFGFAIDSLTNAVLEHNVANNNSDGVLINGTISQDSTLNGNSVIWNGVNGFQFNGTFGGQFVNNSAYANGNAGMVWASALTGTVTNNTSSANGSDGFQFQNGIASSAQFTGNQALNNGGYGFYTTSVAGTFSNNIADSNGLDGIYLGNVTSSGIVDGNLAKNNGNNGFYGTFMDGQFTNNVAKNNSWSGVSFIDSISGVIGNNISKDNVGHGFYLNSLTSTAVVQNNTAIHNATGFTGVGFNGYTQNAGLVTGNTAKDNATTGFLFTETLTGTFSSNTATHNGTDGFGLSNGIGRTGVLNGNTSNNNGGQGYDISSNTGTATGNTGSGNTGGQNQYP